MGVPGFFAWLLKNYKNRGIILDNISKPIETLYLDANCLFHPQCLKVALEMINESQYNTKTVNIDELEKKMIKRIIKYIEYLINFVNPQKKIFIAVDGVAPLAKINQQRKRRYKYIYENNIKDAIKMKYNKGVNNWNNIVITPGTQFMEKLHLEILEYIKKINNREVVYSSYHTYGEGEYKILQDIKTSISTFIGKDNIVIYGLDADLIFLSLASQRSNIYLLREAEYLTLNKITDDITEVLHYVSIDKIKECLNEQIITIINKKYEHEYYLKDQYKEIINDFIFICYFLGNDFLPNLPSIDIKTGGLEFLIDAYSDIFIILNDTLVKFDDIGKVNINMPFLEMFLKRLAKNENYYFQEIFPCYLDLSNKKQCPYSDPFEIEMWQLENMLYFKIEDPIKLGHGTSDEWKFRYYNYYYGTSEYQQNLINEMSLEYLNGLIWITKYYFEKCVSWEWYYKFHNAPFVSDISHYLSSNKLNINHVKFSSNNNNNNNSIILKPYEQLLLVIPPQCSEILPVSYRKILTSIDSPLIDLFPEEITLDVTNKDQLWKCMPILPNIDIKRMKEVTGKLKLTREEEQRNEILENFIIKGYN